MTAPLRLRPGMTFDSKMRWERVGRGRYTLLRQLTPNVWEHDRPDLCGGSFAAPTIYDHRLVSDPVGERNDVAIADAAARASRVVVAWGASFDLARISCDAMRDQDVHVAALLTEAFHGTLECLGRSKDGKPRHPLMLAKSTRPEPW